ncbi:MAG: hypothetical protein HY719_01395 [Planctomycetes bacterium]|nr:hypothetical protein [Planctomycetota bacterium]
MKTFARCLCLAAITALVAFGATLLRGSSPVSRHAAPPAVETILADVVAHAGADAGVDLAALGLMPGTARAEVFRRSLDATPGDEALAIVRGPAASIVAVYGLPTAAADAAAPPAALYRGHRLLRGEDFAFEVRDLDRAGGPEILATIWSRPFPGFEYQRLLIWRLDDAGSLRDLFAGCPGYRALGGSDFRCTGTAEYAFEDADGDGAIDVVETITHQEHRADADHTPINESRIRIRAAYPLDGGPFARPVFRDVSRPTLRQSEATADLLRAEGRPAAARAVLADALLHAGPTPSGAASIDLRRCREKLDHLAFVERLRAGGAADAGDSTVSARARARDVEAVVARAH